MSSINGHDYSCVGASRIVPGWGEPGSLLRLCAAALAAAALAACSQTSGVAERSELRVTAREAPPQARTASIAHRRVATVAKRQKPPAASKAAAGKAAAGKHTSVGIASFYKHGTKTANGEKFNPSELTAAHRTLPFGTRLRVTDVTTGRSVTVRVNDRGPFIPGRIVDVSHSAAETLGFTGRGLAKVKLDILQ